MEKVAALQVVGLLKSLCLVLGEMVQEAGEIRDHIFVLQEHLRKELVNCFHE